MLDFIVSSDLAVVTLKNVLSFLIGQIVESKTEVVLDSNKHHETFVRTFAVTLRFLLVWLLIRQSTQRLPVTWQIMLQV